MIDIKKTYERWLRGELDRDQLHDIEKAALDDPMLYDAMEGIELYQTSDKAQIQDRLAQRLQSTSAPIVNISQSKKKETKVIKMLWPVAVAASLLLAVAVYVLLPSRSADADTIIVDAELPMTEEGQVAMSDELIDPAPEAASPKEEIQEESRTSKEAVAKKAVSSQGQGSVEKSQTAPATDIAAAEEIEKAPEAKSTPEQVTIAVPEELKNTASADIAEAESATDKKITLSDEAAQSPIALRSKLKTKQTPMSITMAADTAQAKDDGGGIAGVQSGAVRSSKFNQRGDTAYPLIGQEAFMDILKKYPLAKDALFMRGIKQGSKITITFELDDEGRPIRITAPFEQEKIETILQESGKWYKPKGIDVIEYQLPVVEG